MKATNKQNAWNIVNEIFPTDYERDSVRSNNAGYDIYYSTADGVNAWISDLNCRLEVNMPDGRSINIWIEEDDEAEPVMSEQEIQEAIEESEAAEKYGEMYAHELFEATSYTKITFCVEHTVWNDNRTEQILYRGLGKDLATVIAGDMVAAYCKTHGIRWHTIEDVKIQHYDHNNGDEYGHYIVSAYVGI